MKNEFQNSVKSLGGRLRKDKDFQAQKEKVYRTLLYRPKTMLMVSLETGILRANICRHCANLQKENRIYIKYRAVCPISKHSAGFYSTHPENVQIKP